jgi:hypothetical protein
LPDFRIELLKHERAVDDRLKAGTSRTFPLRPVIVPIKEICPPTRMGTIDCGNGAVIKPGRKEVEKFRPQ